MSAHYVKPRITTRLAIVAAALCLQPQVTLAQKMPTLDVETSCRADARADPSAGGSAACLADERKAREILVGQWAQFAPEDRIKCTQETTDIAGVQSYVELLTCLQMGKDVKRLPKNYD